MRTRFALVALAVGTLLAAPAAGRADNAPNLGGFSLQARAPAIQMTYDTPDSPAPVHPLFDGTLPEATATLASGPLGHGLASIGWPGPLFGNFGAALLIASPPQPPPPLPQISYPPPSDQQKQLYQQLNDPVRAETFSPQGPADASYQGLPISSHADTRRVEANVDINALTSPVIGKTGPIQSHAVTTFEGKLAVTQAVSHIENISLAGGQVTIGSIVTTATVTTDGTAAKGDGGTIISGLKIAGTPATVDDKGIHLGSQSNNPLAQINQNTAQALARLNLKIVVAQPDSKIDGAKGSYSAGAVVISFNDDALKAVYPALGGHHNMTLSFGGSSASVDATSAFSDATADAAAPSSVSDTPASVAGTSGEAGTPGTPPSEEPGTPAVAGGSSGAAPTGGGSAPPVLATSTADTFGGIAAGLVLLALAVGVGGAYGLRRLSTGVLAEKPPGCPLEEGS